MQCSCFSCCITYRYKQRTAVFLLLLGDSGVGKTSLFISRVTNAPPEEYIPDTYDGWCDTTSLDGKQFQIGCLDTNGGEAYDGIRHQLHGYIFADTVLLCFDISNKDSLDNIELKWIPEIDRYIPATKRVLVGCKADLRSTSRDICISKDEILNVANRLKLDYYETSATTVTGVHECFDNAILLGDPDKYI